jgi:pilus assembly protein CpaB
MNWKTWIPLILAIVLGVVAAKVARDAMLKHQTAGVPNGKMTKVVVAKADISAGKELREEDLTTTDVETEKMPVGSFKTAAEVSGRVTEMMMVKNQPILEQMLAPTGSGSGLQALVPEGMRAITMEVNEFSGVAGLITPGCHVDILATINNGEQGGSIAKTIVQNVKVTAIGQRTSVGGDQPPPAPGEMFKSVTVLASLTDAEAIELACSSGRPRLVLRGGRDNDVVATMGISLGDLRGDAKITSHVETPTTQPAVVIEPTTKPAHVAMARSGKADRKVRIFRGGQESTVTMNVPEGAASSAVTGNDMGFVAPDNSAPVDEDSADPFESN